MRPAYIRVELGDLEDSEGPKFLVSPDPFLYREGELLLTVNTRRYDARSHSELCEVLAKEFHIPRPMLPAARYFKPTKAEVASGERYVYRTAPEGAGEPGWRIRARQALLDAVDRASWSMLTDGRPMVNGNYCNSIEELEHGLAGVAQSAGGREKQGEDLFQPDYDVLVKEALTRDDYLLRHSGLPRKAKKKGV